MFPSWKRQWGVREIGYIFKVTNALLIAVITEDGDAFAGYLLLLGVRRDVHSEWQLHVPGRGIHHLLGASSLHNTIHARPDGREYNINYRQIASKIVSCVSHCWLWFISRAPAKSLRSSSIGIRMWTFSASSDRSLLLWAAVSSGCSGTSSSPFPGFASDSFRWLDSSASALGRSYGCEEDRKSWI